jgi:hypothetical protein
MRRTTLAALMILPVLLCGCGTNRDAKRFDSFRTALAAASEINMEAAVTADYGDSVRAYTLRLTDTAEGSEIEVLAPELIAGVRAHLADGAASLDYDGVILDAGELAPNGLSPLTALPMLVGAAKTGHVDGTWREGGLLAVKLTPDDTVSLTLWLDADTMAPRRAELTGQDDGRRLISCEITDFDYTS